MDSVQTWVVSLRSFLITSGRGERLPAWCAVTALDEEDALELVRSVFGPDGDWSQTVAVEELGPDEIQERIGNLDYGVPVVRGICYPHLDNP